MEKYIIEGYAIYFEEKAYNEVTNTIGIFNKNCFSYTNRTIKEIFSNVPIRINHDRKTFIGQIDFVNNWVWLDDYGIMIRLQIRLDEEKLPLLKGFSVFVNNILPNRAFTDHNSIVYMSIEQIEEISIVYGREFAPRNKKCVITKIEKY